MLAQSDSSNSTLSPSVYEDIVLSKHTLQFTITVAVPTAELFCHPPFLQNAESFASMVCLTV